MIRSLFLVAATTAFAAPNAESLKFFEKDVRPLLVEACQECHGPEKHKGGLRLDNLPYILQGGESGAAIVPHKPDASLLIKLVNYEDPDMEMPPDGKLSADKIEILKKWVAMGAPWPEAEVAAAKPARKPGDITEDDKKWWAFQPVKSPPVPKSKAASPIDAFVQTKLAENGLKPSPAADPVSFIRRATFDLTGLPPTPEEVDAFVHEAYASKEAYTKLIDRLLESPRYGERWAQHWLDVVRYAESEGYRLDAYRPNVWPYRDYVVRSLNNDKPYDQFVREQIAGDEILYAKGKTVPETAEELDLITATGFLRHTIYEYNQRDSEGQWKLIMNEITDVTADVFMGMSVQCAQCHDHKFDPILQKDYYRLQAFLSNITWAEDKPYATQAQIDEYNAKLKAWEEATKEPRAIIDAIIEPKIEAAQKRAVIMFPEEIQAMFAKSRDQRTPYEEQIVQLAGRQVAYERVRYKADKLKEPEATKYNEAKARMDEFAKLKPKPLLPTLAVGETGPDTPTTKFVTRKVGEVSTAPGFLTILDPTDAKIPAPKPDAFLTSLDAPNGFQSTPERLSTTTATQSLLMVNGDWPLDRARAMAARLIKENTDGDAQRVAKAYELTFSRQPTEEETTAAVDFLKSQRAMLQREAPPPPPAVVPIADAQKFLGPHPAARTTKTLLIKPGTPNEKLRVNLEGKIEEDEFAIEAVVKLDSLYPDASVRTIASRWNSDKATPGWALGVTSTKSAYKPNNLIVQLNGFDFQGSPTYEVVASDIRIPTGRPYYIAVSLGTQPAPDQKFGGTITFYARDLSDPDAEMQTVTVAHQVVGGYVPKDRALYVGGRDTDKRSTWDGAIARVALRAGQLEAGNLMTWAANSDPTCIADISADQATTMLKAPADSRWAWESSAPGAKTGGAPDPAREALTDLCHALLNSNEFFYMQ